MEDVVQLNTIDFKIWNILHFAVLEWFIKLVARRRSTE